MNIQEILKKLTNSRLQHIYLGHSCEGNTPNDNCFICNEMMRRGLIPSAEENDLQLAYDMGANPENYN